MSLTRNLRHGTALSVILQNALPQLRALKPLQGVPIRKASKVNQTNPGKLRFAQALKTKKLTARGCGIYEEDTGEIWYREGEHLVRKALDLDALVSDYAASCAGK